MNERLETWLKNFEALCGRLPWELRHCGIRTPSPSNSLGDCPLSAYVMATTQNRIRANRAFLMNLEVDDLTYDDLIMIRHAADGELMGYEEELLRGHLLMATGIETGGPDE